MTILTEEEIDAIEKSYNDFSRYSKTPHLITSHRALSAKCAELEKQIAAMLIRLDQASKWFEMEKVKSDDASDFGRAAIFYERQNYCIFPNSQAT
jgi:predicted nucleic acid-binding protein